MGGGTGRRGRGSTVKGGGTRRARLSSEVHDQRGTPKKKTANKTPITDTQRGQGRAGGGGSREPTEAQRYTSSSTEKRHAEDPH